MKAAKGTFIVVSLFLLSLSAISAVGCDVVQPCIRHSDCGNESLKCTAAHECVPVDTDGGISGDAGPMADSGGSSDASIVPAADMAKPVVQDDMTRPSQCRSYAACLTISEGSQYGLPCGFNTPTQEELALSKLLLDCIIDIGCLKECAKMPSGPCGFCFDKIVSLQDVGRCQQLRDSCQ